MYYRLSEDIALRSWQFVPFACYRKYKANAEILTEHIFKLLLSCDGEHDIEETDDISILEKNKLITRCKKGEHISKWSQYKEYPNRYFPKINIMLTGKCNYNCIHCFNASDNLPLMSEWKYDELLDFLDQADECGFHAFTLTGGEPMLHPQFMDIVREIYSRNMMIFEINTNGSFISQKILDEMKDINCIPLIKISFDGIGCHDFMRNVKGTENRTLDAIRLCIENGFKVEVQMQVNQKTFHSLIPTTELLNHMGVSMLRLLRTTEVARLMKTSPDIVIPMQDYYEKMLWFAGEYIKNDLEMNLYIWKFINIFPQKRSYSIPPVKNANERFTPTAPICRDIRQMIGITSDGEVAPCLQMSGTMKERDVHFGNVHKDKLSEILLKGQYYDLVCCNLYKFKENTPKCAACRHFRYCSGGCPAFSMLYMSDKADFFNPDITRCIFWENGWYEKIIKVMGEWRNLSPIS